VILLFFIALGTLVAHDLGHVVEHRLLETEDGSEENQDPIIEDDKDDHIDVNGHDGPAMGIEFASISSENSVDDNPDSLPLDEETSFMDRVGDVGFQVAGEEEKGEEVVHSEKDESNEQRELVSLEPEYIEHVPEKNRKLGRREAVSLLEDARMLKNDTYKRIVREQACRRRTTRRKGFLDRYDFSVDYDDGKPTTIGEGQLHTAITGVALAAGSYSANTRRERRYLGQKLPVILRALGRNGWGNRQNGKTHPIRHPDDIDFYVERGVQKQRKSPMTKDAFGAIMALCYYTLDSPRATRSSKREATSLTRQWTNYLVKNGWRTHFKYFSGELEKIEKTLEDGKKKTYHKNIFDKNGKEKMFKGPEGYILFPHEVYALKIVARKARIPSGVWNVWGGVVKTALANVVVQFLAPAVAKLCGKFVREFLGMLTTSFSFRVRIGNLGNIRDTVTLGIPATAIDSIVAKVEDSISNAIILAKDVFTSLDRLPAFASIIIDKLMDHIPTHFGRNGFKTLVTQAVEMFSWLNGDRLREGLACLYAIIFLQASNKPDVSSYNSWAIMVIMDERPEVVELVRPAAGLFYDGMKKANNPNGLWAWIADKTSEVEKQLLTFEGQDPDRWNRFAYGSRIYGEWLIEEQKDNLESPRIDYLALEALYSKGTPKSISYSFSASLKRFRRLARTAFRNFLRALTNNIRRTGQYVKNFTNKAGQGIKQVWKDSGVFVQDTFSDTGKQLSRLTKTPVFSENIVWDPATGAVKTINKWGKNSRLIEKTVRDASGVLTKTVYTAAGNFKSLVQYSTSDALGNVVNSNLVVSKVRDTAGRLTRIVYRGNGVIQSVEKWASSTSQGGAKARDMVESKLRTAGGVLTRTVWKKGVLQSVNKWSASTIEAGARAADLVEKKLRSAGGRLQKWTYHASGALKSYENWAKSTVSGAAAFADKTERLLRDASGVLQKWVYTPKGLKSFSKWSKSTAKGAADARDLVESKLREASGVLKKWAYHADGSLKEFSEWSKSTVTGAASAVDQVRKDLRQLGGQLQQWLWNDGTFTRYSRWRNSAANGAVQTKELAIRQIRDALGTLRKWAYRTDGSLQEFNKWSKSTAAGVTKAVDEVERQLRQASGVLERWLWKPNRALSSYHKWWKSTVGGGASGSDIAISTIREASGVLKKWEYSTGKVLTRFSKWAKSTIGGGAVAADLSRRMSRQVNGVLEQWNWDAGVFKDYRKWSKSTALGGASGRDIEKKIVRSANGLLEKWDYFAGGALKAFRQWSTSTINGGATAANQISRKIRQATGLMEKWTWTRGVFQKYYKWRNSSSGGGASGSDLVERLTRLSDGSRLKEIWNSAGQRITSTWDSLGRLVSGGLPKPKWPPTCSFSFC